LFQQSPWHARGSFFFDSITAVLMAFERADFNVPSSADGVPVHAGQHLTGTLQRISFEGVSGWVNLSTADMTSVGQQPRLALSQVQQGQITRIGHVNLPKVEVTRTLLFPGEISDPRAFDMMSGPDSMWPGMVSGSLLPFHDTPTKMVVVSAMLVLMALSCTLGALLWCCVTSKFSNTATSGARAVTFSNMASGSQVPEHEVLTQEVLVSPL